ncbi:MAG: Hsp20/alpha crystallin family protein [Alphaproteobacteria bacterium]|nr:Hsp20/alpha crystallin family protein [Alphaproteobacteria bacterium]
MVERNLTQADWWPHIADPLRHLGARVAEFFSPASEAAATDDAYVVEVELPGVKDDDITIELHDNVLTLKGEKRSSREEKGKTYFFSERTYGAFQRAFRLPADVDAGRIEAHAEDGVLRVRLPKRQGEQATKRTIPIKKGAPKGVTGDPMPNFE